MGKSLSSMVFVLLLVACSGRAGTEPQTPTIPSTTSAVTVPSVTVPTTVVSPPSSTAPAVTTTTLSPLLALSYTKVAGGLPAPIAMTAHPGAAESYLATKDGRVWLLTGESLDPDPVLDLTDQVRNEGEQGLLGMALHPIDQSRLFLHYSNGSGDTVVSEFAVTGGVGDASSERVLLEVGQPASNHNGGMIQFGPDGLLYLGLGDGGGAGDRYGNGQNPDTLLAGIVAIDVDTNSAEKVMSGLRNPWRFWIDGDRIVIGDVGQNRYEEVSVAPLGSGANFGWPITEGLHCYSPGTGCDTTGLTAPILEVEHGDAGTCSITGGVVYRGAEIPELLGRFLFSDYCGGWLRSIDPDDPGTVVDHTAEVGVPGNVLSFGVDGAGEVYVMTGDSLLRLTPVR
jgi:glucose/arabinose dehydrogenase